MVHLDVATAANAVTVISIANLSGRLVLGILSDKISVSASLLSAGGFTGRHGCAAVRAAERDNLLCRDCLRRL